MEIKSARDLRMALARHDIKVTQFARAAGIGQPRMSSLLHEKERLTPLLRGRCERALERVESGEIVPEPYLPRGRNRLERLREEQLASGCSLAIRQS